MATEGNSKCRECKNEHCIIKHCLPAHADFLADNIFEVEVKKKSQLVRQGSLFSGFYFVFDGKFAVSCQGADNKTQLIEFLNDGDSVGFRSIYSNARNSVTVTAIADSQVCFLEKGNFRKLTDECNKLRKELLHRLAGKVNSLDERIRKIAQYPKKKAIADMLYHLYEKFGVNELNCLNVDISRKEIAAFSGTVPEVVSRLLGDLASENAIRLEGRKIYFQDIDKLREAAI